ncbi:MAG: ferritin-like domain-containing protein [Candidatus Eremiobacteraeota bacterium]|nr:ferritin-like domain-containing protein [Candidatus Eremiobacteraeota bacterium]
MRIGSEEHKELFCRTFIDGHKPYEPAELAWPDLDEISLARLRAIPVWTMALEVEHSAGTMLNGYASSETDPLVRRAIELQAFEEERHGRLLDYMVQKYALKVNPQEIVQRPTRAAFVDFGYNECVDSFAGFGIFRLAVDAQILPDALTSLLQRILIEEAHHIVFFINWIAWDRTRRGLHGSLLQALPTLVAYLTAIVRRVKSGGDMAGGDAKRDEDGPVLDLFSDVVSGLTPAKFVRACLEENDRYMSEFDPRLLRPTFIPTLARIALAILEWVEWLRGTNRREARA